MNPNYSMSPGSSDAALADDSSSTASVCQNYENSLRDSDSLSSLGSSSRFGTVNSSILSSLPGSVLSAGHHWAYPPDFPPAKTHKQAEEQEVVDPACDEFGEVILQPGHQDRKEQPSSLVFAIRLPEPGASESKRSPGDTDTASVCSVSIGEPASLSHSDA